MVGTFINVGAIVAGSFAGASIGSRLREDMRNTVLNGLGLVTLLVGLQMALKTENILIVLGAVLGGGVLGELLRISVRIEQLGVLLDSISRKEERQSFAQGFVTASLIFCVGPMAILGSIQDGLSSDYGLLAVKSMLDGFASIAFSASLGWGVAFSALSILVYQGSITLFAGALSKLLSEPMIVEMSATGGLIIVGIALKMMNLKDARPANFLPALVIAPLIVAFLPRAKALLESLF